MALPTQSRQAWMGGTYTLAGTGATTMGAFGNFEPNGNYAVNILPEACTLSNFYVELSNVTGKSKSRTFTVWKGVVTGPTDSTISWSATTIVVTISNAIRGSDTTHSATFAAGDFVQIRQTTSGTPATAHIKLGMQMTPSTYGDTLYSGFTANNQLASSGTELWGLSGGSDVYVTTLTPRTYFNTSGTITDFYIRLETSPDTVVETGGKSDPRRVITLFKNVSTIVAAIDARGVSNNINATGLSHSIVSGDYLFAKSVATNSPRASYITTGFTFVPDNPKEFVTNSTSDEFMRDGAGNLVSTRCSQGGHFRLNGSDLFFAGIMPFRVKMRRSLINIGKVPLFDPDRYVITIGAKHSYIIDTGSSTGIHERNSPNTIVQPVSGHAAEMRDFVTAEDLPTSFKNAMWVCQLWEWVDPNDDSGAVLF